MNIFLDWRDPVEIIFFITLIYYLMKWLAKDTQTNLIYYFYGYLSVLSVAYFFQLTTISSIMILFSPCIALLTVLFHQQTLQKHFINLKQFSPRIPETLIGWDEIFIKVLLQQLNQHKTIYAVIERNENLFYYLKTPFYLDVPLQENLFSTLLASSQYHENELVWLTSTGKLKAINSTWKMHEAQEFILSKSQQSAWKDYAALYTTKTDALIIKSDPDNRTVSMIAQGACVDDLTPAQAHALLQKYCSEKKEPEAQKDYYGAHSVQKHTQQPQQ